MLQKKFFKQLSTMTNAKQKSTQVRQDPLHIHISQIPHQTFYDNRTVNTTHVIIFTRYNQKRHHDITTHVTITHPITITLSHSHTTTPPSLIHYCHSFLLQQLRPLSRSILPPRTLYIALTLNTPGLFRGSARQERATAHPSSPPRAAPGTRQRHLPETLESTSSAVFRRLSEGD